MLDPLDEERVRRKGAIAGYALASRPPHRRDDEARFLVPHESVLTRVGVQPQHRHRQPAAPAGAPRLVQHPERCEKPGNRELARHLAEGNVRGLQRQQIGGGEEGHTLGARAQLFGQVACVAHEVGKQRGHGFLGDRSGDDGRDPAAPGLSDSEIQIVELLAPVGRPAEAKAPHVDVRTGKQPERARCQPLG